MHIQKKLPKKITKRKLETISEIGIRIKGKGKIGILSESFNPKHELLINGEKESKINNYVNNLNDEIKVITMKWYEPLTSCDSMFLGLTNIIKFDFSKFVTSKVENMDSMFFGCSSLTSLNLKNFNTSSVTSMSSMFCTCSSLKILDLSSFNTSLVRDMSNMFSECTSLISINLNNFNTLSLINIYSMFSGCTSLISLDLSYFDAPNVDKMTYMFKECNNKLIYCINDSKTYKFQRMLESFKKNCSDVCFTNPNHKFIIIKNECINDCKNDENYQAEYNNICYESCPEKTHNSYDNICQDDTIENLIKTNDIKEENMSDCNPIDFYNNLCIIKKNNSNTFKDYMINNIKDEIINGSMNSLIDKIIDGEKKDLIKKEENIIYQIVSSENQKNNKYNNISTILLGECENILKSKYNITENKPLLIFKIDYFLPDSLIPIIGYEVFHPENKSKLNLAYCKNELINFNIPVVIDEENLFKYNPDSEYYTDECYPYTTENGTDILLNDRHDEYNENNMSLCEKNCVFKGYESETQNARCECEIKSKQLVISEIINQTDLLHNNFTYKDESSNMITMKCYYVLFTKEGLSKNIGNYIIAFLTIWFLISGILFFKVGYEFLEEDINKIMSFKKKEKKKSVSLRESENIKKKKAKNKKLCFNQSINSTKKANINSNNEFIYSNKNLELYNCSNNKNVYDISNNFTDYELNTLSYDNAQKYDKRNYLEFYISLIKRKHPLIFSFFPLKDYNSRIIKINLFLLYFSMFYFISALLFNETIIHKIYKDGGAYNFLYLIPHILYSFLISHIIITIIKFISLSDRNISEIKKKNYSEKLNEFAFIVKKKLKIKYTCFFILSLVYMGFLWFYLSSFGAVYRNTQTYIIKNILIEFGLSQFYPFFINLIPGIFRIYSLKNQRKKWIYIISRIIQLI